MFGRSIAGEGCALVFVNTGIVSKGNFSMLLCEGKVNASDYQVTSFAYLKIANVLVRPLIKARENGEKCTKKKQFDLAYIVSRNHSK
jgi:hypothetical protein